MEATPGNMGATSRVSHNFQGVWSSITGVGIKKCTPQHQEGCVVAPGVWNSVTGCGQHQSVEQLSEIMETASGGCGQHQGMWSSTRGVQGSIQGYYGGSSEGSVGSIRGV
jgi:hypothetical protein